MLKRRNNAQEQMLEKKKKYSRKGKKGLHQDQLSQQAPTCLSLSQRAYCPGFKILLGDHRNVLLLIYLKNRRKNKYNDNEYRIMNLVG